MKNNDEQMNFTRLAIATIAGVLILGGAVYAAYRYSQRQSGDIVLPGGVTYLGPSPTTSPMPTPTAVSAKNQQPPTAPLRLTAASNVAWKTQSGKIYPYQFSYPSTLTIVVFPDDAMDSIAIVWGNIPPQQNILLNMEFIDKRDPNLTTQPKVEYVKNWYKFFSGLKGVEKVTPFTNTNGMKGYKASYINYANTSPNIDVFFEIPGNDTTMIHLANGILDPPIFDKIVESVKWTMTTAQYP